MSGKEIMLKNNNDADFQELSKREEEVDLESFFIAGVIIIIRLSANQGEEKLFKDASTKIWFLIR